MLKVFGIGGVVGGVLRVIASFVTETENPDLLELLYIATDLGLILGLVGIYLIHRESLPEYGHVGFVIALGALSFIAGPDASIYGVGAYEIGAPAVGVGILVLAFSQLRSASYGHLGAIVLISSVALGGLAMVLPGYPIFFTLTGVLFGTGFVINGMYVYANSSGVRPHIHIRT